MGLEMAIAKEPDLMIVDQQMPRLTGLEVLQKLRDRGLDIPAILATAHGSEDTAVAAFRLGIRDYIIKPFDADEISDSVDRALRESRLQRERDQLVQQLMESNSQLQRRAQELNVLYGVGKSVLKSDFATSMKINTILNHIKNKKKTFFFISRFLNLKLLKKKKNVCFRHFFFFDRF